MCVISQARLLWSASLRRLFLRYASFSPVEFIGVSRVYPMKSVLLLAIIITSSIGTVIGSRCECQKVNVLNDETQGANTDEHEMMQLRENDPPTECPSTSRLLPLPMDIAPAELSSRPAQPHELEIQSEADTRHEAAVPQPLLPSHSGQDMGTRLFRDSVIESLTSDESRLFLKAFGERIQQHGDLSRSERTRLLQLPMPVVLSVLNTYMPRVPFLKYLHAVRNRGISSEYEMWRYLIFQQKMDATMRKVYERLTEPALRLNATEQVGSSAAGSGAYTSGASDILSIALTPHLPRVDEAHASSAGADVTNLRAGTDDNPSSGCDCDSCEDCSCEDCEGSDGLCDGCNICQACCELCGGILNGLFGCDGGC